jgi:hypothetical protein
MPVIFVKIISLIPIIWEIIRKVIPFIKKRESLIAFCDDSGEFFDFKEHVVIPDYDILHKSLMEKIKSARKKGKVLILNLSEVKQANNDTIEALRDCIRDAIINNNIRLRVIFPKKGMNDLFKDVAKLSRDRDCKSINIKKVK